MKKRVFLSGSAGVLLYTSSVSIEKTTAQVSNPNGIEKPSVPTVSDSQDIVIPVLPFGIEGKNLDKTSDITLTYQLVRDSDNNVIDEQKRSIKIKSSNNISVKSPRVELRANGSKFEKTGTDVKIKVIIQHPSISSNVSTNSPKFNIIQSDTSKNKILIVPEGERVTSYEQSYKLTRWEKGGRLAIENGDSLTLEK